MVVDWKVREAAQALLLAELERLGEDGRQALVNEWSTFLPAYSDLFAVMSNQPAVPNPGGNSAASTSNASGSAQVDPSSAGKVDPDFESDQDDEDDGEGTVLSVSHPIF